jgi:CheY-like chemotaxis protein
MKNNIACCQFPTTVLFLDDKSRFLESLVLNLDENFPYKMFTNADDALNFLANDNKLAKSHHNWLENRKSGEDGEFSEGPTHIVVDINIADIYKEIYASNRFSEISIIVVDYAMPGMNGLEFARKVKQLESNAKIFMVTGEAEDSIAIQAFNEGIIDRFVKKNAPGFYTELNIAINQLHKEYFDELSENIINNLSANPNCCLNDAVFIEFFQEFCWHNNIIEYYLIDELGSFLLLDKLGVSTFLIIKSAGILDDYANIAADNDAPANVCDALSNKEKIPFFFSQEDLELPVEMWSSYLHTATKLEGKKNQYYYAIVKDAEELYDIKRSKIVPYVKYSCA